MGAARVLSALSALALGARAGDPGPATCAWGRSNDPRCDDPAYRGPYPACAVFQYGDRTPIPCIGDAGACAGDAPPTAASWHVHVFFPNVACTNCSAAFAREAANFTFAGALELRAALATFLNAETARIAGAAPRDPIDAARAGKDLDYDRCQKTRASGADPPAGRDPGRDP